MQTARRRGRASFLSQIPEIPPTVSKSDPLTDFFIAVQRTYERAQEAMETAKSGYNLDVAKITMTGSGGAQEWNDKAFDLLKQAKEQNLITADDASELAQQVMTPLGDILGKANEAIVRGGDGILSYWDAFQSSVASIVSNSTGWGTKKWHDLAKTYRLVDDYLKGSNEFLLSIQGAVQSMDAKSYLEAYRLGLGKMDAQKTYLETVIQSAGIPLSALKDAAAKEDVSTLGAGPAGILGYVIVGGVTVAMVLKAIGAVLAIMGTAFLFGATDTALALVGLDSVVVANKKKLMKLEEEAKSQLEKDKAEASASSIQKRSDEINAEIKKTQRVSDGLAKVTGMQDKADELKKKVAAERARLGSEAPVVDQDWFPWTIAIGGGIGLAVLIYWYTHRNNA